MTRQNFLEFKDNLEYNFKIKYPVNWEKRVAKMNTIVAYVAKLENPLEKFRENFTIMVRETDLEPSSIDQLINIEITQLKEAFLDFQLIKKKKTTMSQIPAYQIIFIGKKKDLEVKIKQYYTLKDNLIYLLTYTAEVEKYDKFLKIVKKMIKSFEFI